MIKTKPWCGGVEEEYETQHFGFGSQRLKISVRQMVEQKITNGVKEMESNLQTSLNLNETDTATLTRSCDKLIRLYCKRAEPSLDIVDEEIERLLTVPPNVLLPEDEIQIDQLSNQEYLELRDEVASLRQRVLRGALMESILTAEEEELSSLEKVCEISRKDMETIDLLFKNVDSKQTLEKILCDTDMLCASVPLTDESEEHIFPSLSINIGWPVYNLNDYLQCEIP